MKIKLLVRVKGGPGSGNWGHAGRPGKRGGSAPRATGSGLSAKLDSLKSKIADAAQGVLDEYDPEWYGGGGICDDVCQEIDTVLAYAGIDTIPGGQQGSDHAYTIAYNDEEAYEVDIPSYVYERGGGYSWEVLTDAKITADDVMIHKIPESDLKYVLPEVFGESD